MFQKSNHIVWMFLFCCLTFLTVQGQNEINSPYSSYGIGDINRSSNGILDAMGGVSYGMQNPYYINFRNPASYAAFDSLSFIADVSASVYVSTLYQNIKSQQNTYAQPGYLAIGLPVTRHWRTSLGILPFSSVGYDMETTSEIENIGKVTYNYKGNGGIYQLYWGNAFKICKGLSIGLNASYIFGTIYSYRNTAFDGSNYTNTFISDAYQTKGLYLDAGLQYMFNIADECIGVITAFKSGISVGINRTENIAGIQSDAQTFAYLEGIAPIELVNTAITFVVIRNLLPLLLKSKSGKDSLWKL